MLFWHVPAPRVRLFFDARSNEIEGDGKRIVLANEALLISGSKRHKDATQFRIVTGHGCFVVPVKQRARLLSLALLSLALREVEISEDCITNQGIRMDVRAVAAFKVGDDPASIANAARRFLSEQDRMETLVGRIFAGHLRSIIGGLTVEQIIRERDRVAQEIKDGSHSEMEKLGIVVDALEIQEIEDATGYINNLAAPHAAAAASQARIAKSKADLEATERELAAQATKAQYERDMAIKQAGYLAETREARARAEQAGPLAEAQARQQVIQQQTALAQHRAELAAQRLEAEVRRPADAEAYKARTLAEARRDQERFATEAEAFRKRNIAEADRDQARLAAEADAFRQRNLAEAEAEATRVRADAQAHAERVQGEAQADAERAKGQAQADANAAFAASLREGNQELIAATKLIENLPRAANVRMCHRRRRSHADGTSASGRGIMSLASGTLLGMADVLTLMAVHAHPDDEASGGGILATYADQGIRVVVVTCTNGEFGDAPGGIKPGQDGHTPAEVARLRLAELDESAQILQVSALETLGYHDSGMEEWEYKARPDAFCNVPLDVVSGRIGELIAKYRPQVFVTYDDAGAYQHPDHVHASRAAQAAAAATGIPAKVYLSTMKGSNWRKIWDALREAGEEVPSWDDDSAEAQERARRALDSEARITTTVDIRPVLDRKRAALFAHGSQINDSWFSKLPAEVAEQAFGYEYFIRITDSTGTPLPEADLFAGLRTGA